MEIRLNDEFFKKHAIKTDSVARFEYSLFKMPELVEEIDRQCVKRFGKDKKSIAMRSEIEQESNPEALLNWMRKPMDGLCQSVLQKRVLSLESSMESLIKEKSLSVMQNTFIENAINFFLNSKENYSEWIYLHYPEVRSEYMKSMFCLVLGCRGEREMIPFLAGELERMEIARLLEYSQGPLMALFEMRRRFGDELVSAE